MRIDDRHLTYVNAPRQTSINETAFDHIFESLSGYRPNLTRSAARATIECWLATGNVPLGETSQDVVFAYQEAIERGKDAADQAT